MPYAAETPIAGAPRTTMSLMPAATSSYVFSSSHFSSVGSRRWSSIATPSSVHLTGMMFKFIKKLRVHASACERKHAKACISEHYDRETQYRSDRRRHHRTG